MDFLNQIMRWLASAWRGLPAVGRAGIVVAVPLALVGGSYLGRPTAGRDEAYLFGGSEFTAADLARMEAAFGKARLSGARIDGPRVAVPNAQRDLYLKALVDQQALPETFYSAQERALLRDNVFSSQRQRDTWMKLAHEQEIALIVRKIKGIEEVCVQYDDIDTNEFPRRKRRRATVAVRAVEGRQLEPEMVQAIRSTVMTAAGALQAGDVTVLDLNAGRAYSGGEDDAVRQAESDYAAARHKYEEQYQSKIARRLNMFPAAIVAVSVELQRAADDSATAPLIPRDVSASISLPRSTVVDAWRQTRPDFGPTSGRSPEAFELRRIEDDLRRQIQAAIAPLLPNPSENLITVDTFADGELAVHSPAVGGPSWLTTLADKEWLIALTLVSFSFLAWQANRKAPTSARPAPLALPRPGGVPRELGTRDAAGAAWLGGRPSAQLNGESPDEDLGDRRGTLRDQLADRVKEDPRRVAEALRHWLGNDS